MAKTKQGSTAPFKRKNDQPFFPTDSVFPKPKIQREESEGQGDQPVSFNFELLPPSVQLRVSSVLLNADTGKAALGFSRGLHRIALGYKYGSDLSLGYQYGDLSTRLGVNPGSGDLSLGVRRGSLRFSGGYQPGVGGFNLGLQYGRPLMPFPHELESQVYGGYNAATAAVGAFPGSDPISYYRAQSENISSVISAVKSVRRATDPENYNFGAALTFTFNPRSGFMVHGGLQWRF